MGKGGYKRRLKNPGGIPPKRIYAPDNKALPKRGDTLRPGRATKGAPPFEHTNTRGWRPASSPTQKGESSVERSSAGRELTHKKEGGRHPICGGIKNPAR